jgi:hypothetical protein
VRKRALHLAEPDAVERDPRVVHGLLQFTLGLAQVDRVMVGMRAVLSVLCFRVEVDHVLVRVTAVVCASAATCVSALLCWSAVIFLRDGQRFHILSSPLFIGGCRVACGLPGSAARIRFWPSQHCGNPG